VRLEQGDYARVSIRAGRPAEVVARFAAAGARLIHVVDLDGARAGAIRPEAIAELCMAAGNVPVQASGGIRSISDAESLLEAGAARVVVGTAAFAGSRSLESFAKALGDRLVVAIDSRSGVVAVAGWSETVAISVDEAADRCRAAGVHRLHCTAIDRDGTLAGPDLELLERIRLRAKLPVLAAGGIRSEEDLDRLAVAGLEGAVVGRALLEGRIPLSVLGRA
jgi:phosphoribosylformimino-5-aminoimidazole carboxamide ribotide isomerase